jgi:hypothetical protein
MDGPRHLQLQRYQPRRSPRSPANRPSGADRPTDRSRTVDFTDFTSRRRSSGHEGNNAGPSAESDADGSAAPAITPLAEHDRRASPSVLPVRAPRAAMEPRPRQREPRNRCRLGMRDGDGETRGPELALEPGTACGRAVAAHVPLAPTTAAGRFAQSPPAWHRLRRGGVRPLESPLPHVAMLRTTFELMGVRIALVCTHRRTEREWEQ